MLNKHYLFCDAPVCAGDPNLNYKNEVLWYPSEKVCGQKPYERFQQKQLQINKETENGTFKNLDESYGANELENRSI